MRAALDSSKRELMRDTAGSSAAAQALFRDRNHYRSFLSGEDASFAVIAGLYATILAALGSVWFATRGSMALILFVGAVVFIVIGWAQYSLGNALHEAAHRNLRNRKSDVLAAIVTAYPIGLTMGYRDTHLMHHQHLGTDKDPEFQTYAHFPRSRLQFLWRLVGFASGWPALLQFVQQQAGATNVRAGARFRETAPFLAVQAVIFALFWLTFANPLFYFIFWAAPVATVGKLIATTRLLCEHSSPDRDWVVRTIHARRWQTWLFGAFDFNYHGEHHLFASVPFAQLGRLHRLHRQYFEEHRDYRPFDGRFEFFEGGYLSLLTRWFHALPWRQPKAA